MRRYFTPLMGLFVLVILNLAVLSCTKTQDTAKEDIHEIQWITNMDIALVLANEQNKPLVVDFMATWCPPCRMMEDSTFSDPVVIRKSMDFIPVRIDVDKQENIANKYNGNASKYGGVGIPNILFMTSEEKKLKHPIGYIGPKDFIAIMDSVLEDIE